jgi:hypothetical protein
VIGCDTSSEPKEDQMKGKSLETRDAARMASCSSSCCMHAWMIASGSGEHSAGEGKQAGHSSGNSTGQHKAAGS